MSLSVSYQRSLLWFGKDKKGAASNILQGCTSLFQGKRLPSGPGQSYPWVLEENRYSSLVWQWGALRVPTQSLVISPSAQSLFRLTNFDAFSIGSDRRFRKPSSLPSNVRYQTLPEIILWLSLGSRVYSWPWNLPCNLDPCSLLP